VGALQGWQPTSAANAGVHTFVFADLAGYTALTEAHGDEHAAEVAAAFFAAVRLLLPEYRAEEVKTIGDALLVRVADPSEAVHLAARLVSDFGARHRSLGVRVGMDTGTAVERDGDWFGTAVNLAARVADAARAGEVLMTSSTQRAAGGAVPPGQFRTRGRRAFRNVSEPVDLVALALDESSGVRQLPLDPVCRMAIDPDIATERRAHGGVEYYFCSVACARAFEADPRRYTRRRRGRDTLLVSDVARDNAVRALGRGYAKGRLTREELEERTQHALAARTRADLQAVTHDLPRRLRRASLWLFFPPVWLFLVSRRSLRRGRRRLRSRRNRELLR
jgi:class 3 adenylate cyclase/YHS domain-containing protein